MKAHWRRCPSVACKDGLVWHGWERWATDCPTCKGKGRIRVRPKAAKKDEAAPRQSKFMRHMNMYGGNRRVSMTTLMRKIP